MITVAQIITGKNTSHLTSISEKHQLHSEVADAFLAMQQQALSDGFNLLPASSFRNFQRQQTIWNEKFNGIRPLLNASGTPIEANTLPLAQRCQSILFWSALPGASRHHWGTDIDVYDPHLLPVQASLQLEPWEYEQNGYFFSLNQWLDENISYYGFFKPYRLVSPYIAIEPWHISHQITAKHYETMLTEAWKNEHIEGIEWLLSNIDTLIKHYVRREL